MENGLFDFGSIGRSNIFGFVIVMFAGMFLKIAHLTANTIIIAIKKSSVLVLIP